MDEIYIAFLRLVVLRCDSGGLAAEAARALVIGRDTDAARRVGPMSRYLPMSDLTSEERAIVAAAAALAAGSPRPSRGRQPEGDRVPVRMQPDLIAQVDAWAAAHDVSTRAEAVRQLVRAGLAHIA